MNKRRICMLVVSVFILLLLIWEIFNGAIVKIEDETVKGSINMAVTRALGSVVFVTLVIYLGYRVIDPLKKNYGRALLFSVPALLVVVNNLPIYPLISGAAWVDSPFWRILLLATECLFIGICEEFCFRGVIFLGFLKNRRSSKTGQLWAIVLTSAVFGAVHLFNIFVGASPLSVLLQIGYSFLIGSMCAVVLMKTHNIWLISILHAVFDFCGALVPTCGGGVIWDGVTVAVTVVLAVLTTAYMVNVFLKIKSEELEGLYKKC